MSFTTPLDARAKLEAYCAYQERCHDEVSAKLRALGQEQDVADEIIVHLINNNYLNEERFARSFARGKHRIKHWGKVRIVSELKFRNISAPLIKAALTEIDDGEYLDTFETLADRHWSSITESNILKKRKKFCDFLLRKGYESQLIYSKVQELEQL